MKNARGRSERKSFHLGILIGTLIFAGAASVVPLISVSSHETRTQPQTRAVSENIPSKISMRALSLSPALSLAEGVAVYDADCVTPKSDFNLGDVVCVKATGVPDTVFSWKVAWVDTAGFVRVFDTAIASDEATYTFTLPTDPTSIVADQTVRNVGTWRVTLNRFSGQIRQIITFTVHEPANPAADVFVQKFARQIDSNVPSGNNIPFTVVVGNNGPDSAATVNLVDTAPSGFSVVSFTQESGPSCLPAGEANCTIALMAHDARAEFTVLYNSGASPQGAYSTSATVSSVTTELDNSNNTATAEVAVTAATGAGTCDLTCPTSITVNANTTEGGQRGAHVNYPEPVGTGTCGSISSTPASGSFFPVGTTIVTATSETGDGSCQFTVTVEETSGNVSIACPANLEGNANSDCEASFNLGTPTTSGDNVTLTVSRSDGKPMYDCDQNGENCVRKTTDLPFAAGTTIVTWTAYSHDTPGPYASPDDEEAHRTGSATCQQMVTVNDTTAPVIAATDQTVSADENCQAVIPDYSSTVSDNCACSSSDDSDACVGHPNFTVTQTPAPGTVVGPGAHTIQITANDGSSNNNGEGNTSVKEITFTVNDTTPPQITCPANMTVNTLPGTCSAIVVTGTATAADNCDTTPTITATRSDNQPLTALFPKGTTTITWRATDDAGNYSECSQTITVVDDEAPTITFNGLTPSMWPPNHSYHTFTAANFIASVSDNCDSLSVNDVDIISASSDESENGGGDGNTLNDIIVAADCKSVQLRAERQNSGNGRVYTITFRLRDASGNTTTGTAKVYAPKSNSQTPVDDGPQYVVTGSCP